MGLCSWTAKKVPYIDLFSCQKQCHVHGDSTVINVKVPPTFEPTVVVWAMGNNPREYFPTIIMEYQLCRLRIGSLNYV